MSWEPLLVAGQQRWNEFQVAMADPRRTQEAILQSILSANGSSRYGREFGFDALNTIEAFQAALPVNSYEEIRERVMGAKADGTNSFLADPILLYEETSGTSGQSKLVPHTRTSLESFRDTLLPWLHKTVQAWPGIAQGRAYWAISPALSTSGKSVSGIPLGVENDALYFGEDLAPAFMSLSVVGAEVAEQTDFEAWRYGTALSLLKAGDLSLISIWSPSFLFPILETIRTEQAALIQDLEAAGEPARAVEIRAVLEAGRPLEQIWPQLEMISCWTHAHAAPFAAKLRREFPKTYIQGKGLLATEGIVTIPLEPHPYPVLAVNAGFFEFFEGGNSYLCDELVEDRVYRLVMTGFNGLYRYDIGDLVRMRGWAAPGLPMLEFVGRTGCHSDLCGEKLTEPFALNCLSDLTGFRALAPCRDGWPGYYLLLDKSEYSDREADRLAVEIDQRLRRNFHYDYARNLTQLRALQPLRIKDPLSAFHRQALAAGRRLGDVKPPVLMEFPTGWSGKWEVASCASS